MRSPSVRMRVCPAVDPVRFFHTGLVPGAPIPPPEAVDRQLWSEINLAGMRRVLDPVVERLEGRRSGVLAGGPLRSVAGALLALEVGGLTGLLSQRVLGQYELVLLDEAVEDRPPRLLFVLPNLGQAVNAFGAEEQQFMTWVTLHEVTHAVQFAGVPWLHGHVAGLVRELLKSAELRIDADRKLHFPSGAEIRRVGTALRHGDLISVFTTSAERETLDRVQAVMAGRRL